ncbi:hypothetical protein MJO52_12235 [Microbulbifer variabilis]|uniref:Uncharacterized protein n=1 Tax=Microbulbifer variabilis TaxID=266805 RepID=A0ABY4V7E1_9GAMM|nr:hypothetical protein [Microbulbifer variabilis]USD19850.1 hypothetical protein MJO52_12235 [Microbulbifer variabilis]
MNEKFNIFLSSLFILVVVIGLSIFAGVAYIYTLCGLSVWAVIGHLVTLDDDMPGEWSNMEGSPEVWRRSRVELLIKSLVMFALLVITMAFPGLGEYGAH